MRAASFLPSVPRQPCTLYEAMRTQLSGSWSDSACQLARLWEWRLILVNTPAHCREPAFHRDDGAGEQRHRDGDEPPVDVAGAGGGGFDGVAEDGGGGRTGQEADGRAEGHVPEPHVDRTGDDALDREGRD